MRLLFRNVFITSDVGGDSEMCHAGDRKWPADGSRRKLRGVRNGGNDGILLLAFPPCPPGDTADRWQAVLASAQTHTQTCAREKPPVKGLGVLAWCVASARLKYIFTQKDLSRTTNTNFSCLSTSCFHRPLRLTLRKQEVHQIKVATSAPFLRIKIRSLLGVSIPLAAGEVLEQLLHQPSCFVIAALFSFWQDNYIELTKLIFPPHFLVFILVFLLFLGLYQREGKQIASLKMNDAVGDCAHDTIL